MKPEVVGDLWDPVTKKALSLEKVELEIQGEIVEGQLRTEEGVYPIRKSIPRFVPDNGYTANFAAQWNRFRRAQLDSATGLPLSHDRFYLGTGWTPEELRGQRVLEVGCGAGRFTEILLAAGAEVYAVDTSTAVDACYENHGAHANLYLFQADLYALPFAPAFFDKVFCYGVLQHTPDVKKAFMSMVPFLKPGGKIAVDVYVQSFWPSRWMSKYWYRSVTKRLPPDVLFQWLEWYIPKWLPIDTAIERIPIMGSVLTSLIPCWNYTGRLPLSQDQIEKWAVLDTFDALSAWYDSPQTVPGVQKWFDEAGLSEIDVRRGGNGILGNARKP